MTEKAAEAAAETAVETITEIVEHIPVGMILLAFALGGAVVFLAMIAVSKPPADNIAE